MSAPLKSYLSVVTIEAATSKMSATFLLVPKQDQPAYALEHFKIADLSALPVDWTNLLAGRSRIL